MVSRLIAVFYFFFLGVLYHNAVATGTPPPYGRGFKLDPADYHHMFFEQKNRNCNRPPWQPVATHFSTVSLWVLPSGASTGGKFTASFSIIHHACHHTEDTDKKPLALVCHGELTFKSWMATGFSSAPFLSSSLFLLNKGHGAYYLIFILTYFK